MLVYGDREKKLPAAGKLAGIRAALARLSGMRPGIESHGELVAAFIEAGELAQGLADREFHAAGRDVLSPVQDEANRLTAILARSILASWNSGFTQMPAPDDDEFQAKQLAGLSGEITCRQAEGFAFYALYPEAYAAAAARSGLGGDTRIVGIRSIGAALAALAQAALGADRFFTVRPTGHPFKRELSLDDALRDAMLAPPDPPFAIVDEGPGLSGSSFGAVLDRLLQHGVGEDRIHLFPSHGGDPGAQAGPGLRQRWPRLRRHFGTFEEVILEARSPTQRMAGWFADLIGPARSEPLDIAGGRWRALQYGGEAEWPPAIAHQERRKYLVETGSGRWLLKFAGLGLEGRRKAERAQALSAQGFTPRFAGWRHGFSAERWLEGGVPLVSSQVDSFALAESVGRYLGFRARSFPASRDRGASLPDLLVMARHNAEEVLGSRTASAFARWSATSLAALGSRARPVEVDGRMHAWEWLVTPDGRVLKTDAVDHHAAHDLVGCQEVAWDVAGAEFELALTTEALDHLCAVVMLTSGLHVDRELLSFLKPCYLSFQLGVFTMAADAAPDEPERLRILRHVERYKAELRRVLLAGDAGPP
jgi:hypothetical protein